MQVIRGIKQGSEDWKNIRCGVITASRFKDVLAKGQGKTRSAYMKQLVAEMLTGEPLETYVSTEMKWGTETEPQARSVYELDNAVEVEEVSFIKYGELSVGVSPDGLVGNNGVLEIKCPSTVTHIDTLLYGKMPQCHTAQVQGQLWVSEREWCDFVSFDPRIKTDKSYFCVRVYRDEEYIKNLKSEVTKFAEELHELVKKLSQVNYAE